MAEKKKPSWGQRAEYGCSTDTTINHSRVCACCKAALDGPGWAAELAALAHRHGYADLLADLGAMAPAEAYGAYLWLKRREGRA